GPSDGGGRFPPEGWTRERACSRSPERAVGGATNAGDTLHLVNPLALGERHRDEARLPTTLYTHKDAVLVFVVRRVDRLAHVAGIGNALACDLENDVAFLEAPLGRCTLRVDLGDDDAFLAGTGNTGCGRNRQAELRHVDAAGGAATLVIVVVGLGLHVIGQLAQG